MGNQFTNVLAYADDLVLLAQSWKALQFLLNILEVEAAAINITRNTSKTVCMVSPSSNRNCIIGQVFPSFVINQHTIKFVPKFKYLGHIISNNFTDDEDIDREIRNMFVRCKCNTLARKFVQCSLRVKMQLFKTFCLCFYDIALWSVFKCGTIQKFRSCYHKCIKLYFLSTDDLTV